jgi:hypothetical protein
MLNFAAMSFPSPPKLYRGESEALRLGSEGIRICANKDRRFPDQHSPPSNSQFRVGCHVRGMVNVSPRGGIEENMIGTETECWAGNPSILQ